MKVYLAYLSGVLSIFLLPVKSLADSIYVPSIAGQFTTIENTSAQSDSKLKEKIRFSGSLKSFGRFSGWLDSENLNIRGNQNSQARFFQGTVYKRRDKSRVYTSFATAIRKDNGDYKIRLFVILKKRNSSRQKMIEINLDHTSRNKLLRAASVNYARGSRYSLSRTCLNNAKGHEVGELRASGDLTTNATYNYFKLLVEADAEYVQKVPDAFTEIATQINGVDAIYKRDLGLALTTTIVPEAQIYAQPIILDQDFAFPIHTEMTQRRPPATRNADVHFLMSGKTPIGADIEFLAGAVPDIGALCRNPELSVGFTIRYDSAFDLITTAHEMGHLLGGEHDDDATSFTNPGIMNSGTSNEFTGEIERFSNFSQNQIGSYIDTFGSCLVTGDDGSGTTTPPTGGGSYTIEGFKDGKFLGLYVSSGDVGIEGTSVSVLYRKNKKVEAKTIRSGTTDEDGLYYFVPKKTGFYQFLSDNQLSRQFKFRKLASKTRRR